ncbi:Ig-like domain-containing protein [Corynebacterium yudongzhengii]|uniref:L,D-transpeptidase n=1 Tax=Corynebacterium yudongzhengii TaxID=2080740 RepID=UPI0039A08263
MNVLALRRSSAVSGVVKVVAVASALTLLAGGLVACTIGSAETGDPDKQESSEAQQPTPEVDISVADGTTDHNPTEPVKVTASHTTLEDVEMVNEEGNVVESVLNDDATEWQTDEVLGYNRTYTLTVTDAEGEEEEITFETISPEATTSVALGPLADSVVGVGQAITFVFGTAPSDREAVEEAITVETSNDTNGAFYWVSDRDLRWRPEEFWEPGTEVSVEADIYGLDMGDGLYGETDNATNFTIGDKVHAVVDDNTKTMNVYRNDELLRSIPVSMGRDGTRWATPNGTYVVGDERESMVMDSATFGLAKEDGGYETEVDYATQLSYSGIYVHAAPWSQYAQGSSNTSHGCINVSTEDARWFQETVKRGDPVVVKNTTADTLPAWDGLGHWNMDWETWEAGNA